MDPVLFAPRPKSQLELMGDEPGSRGEFGITSSTEFCKNGNIEDDLQSMRRNSSLCLFLTSLEPPDPACAAAAAASLPASLSSDDSNRS